MRASFFFLLNFSQDPYLPCLLPVYKMRAWDGWSLKAFISAGLVNKCLSNTRCIPEAKRQMSSPTILNCSKGETQEGQAVHPIARNVTKTLI